MTSWLGVVEVGFKVGECGSHTAAAAYSDLCGGDGWHRPMSAQECRQFLCGGWQQLDRLEPRLEPLRQQIELQVAGAKERSACWQAVEVGEQEVLRFAGTVIEFIDDLDRP